MLRLCKEAAGPHFKLGLMLAGDVLLADQITKWLLLITIHTPERTIKILPFFNLVRVWNTGISFGMLAARHQPALLTVLSLVIVALLLTWLYRTPSRLMAGALALVIGGAVGNVVDRLRFGAVVDFLDVHAGRWHWPAFNLADSCIFIGVVLLCAGSMFNPHPNEGSRL